MHRLTERERAILRRYRLGYGIIAFVATGMLTMVLILAISHLPAFSHEDRPANNEVTGRYIEKGAEETGAANIVTAIVLDYRAFDTLGESLVLFIAFAAVILLLHEDEAAFNRRFAERKPFEPEKNQIFQVSAQILIPSLLMFGIYVILNGHLSPGGGFSGGAIIGAAAILYKLAFGLTHIRRWLPAKRLLRLMVFALFFYGLAKGYVFFAGGNHLPGIIPLGQAGSIFSGGLIMPLNIAVGIVVAGTIYGVFALFNRGGL
jgi:multicomponent Na+:H+ antiporter subunit B